MENRNWSVVIDEIFFNHNVPLNDPRRLAARQRMQAIVNNATVTNFFNAVATRVANECLIGQKPPSEDS